MSQFWPDDTRVTADQLWTHSEGVVVAPNGNGITADMLWADSQDVADAAPPPPPPQPLPTTSPALVASQPSTTPTPQVVRIRSSGLAALTRAPMAQQASSLAPSPEPLLVATPCPMPLPVLPLKSDTTPPWPPSMFRPLRLGTALMIIQLPPRHLRAAQLPLTPPTVPMPMLPSPIPFHTIASSLDRPYPFPTHPPCEISALGVQGVDGQQLDLCAMIPFIDQLRTLFHPAAFKFGITRNLGWRFWNSEFGYYVDGGWDHMQALHVGTPSQAGSLEACLISTYAHIGELCNVAPGGESLPPEGVETWTYIVLKNVAYPHMGESHRLRRLADPRVIHVQPLLEPERLDVFDVDADDALTVISSESECDLVSADSG